jgi:hypothetical protein
MAMMSRSTSIESAVMIRHPSLNCPSALFDLCLCFAALGPVPLHALRYGPAGRGGHASRSTGGLPHSLAYGTPPPREFEFRESTLDGDDLCAKALQGDLSAGSGELA